MCKKIIKLFNTIIESLDDNQVDKKETDTYFQKNCFMIKAKRRNNNSYYNLMIK